MAEKNSLWRNIRNKAAQNKRTGATPKKPTTEMIRQERKIKAKHPDGGTVKRGFLEEREFRREYDKYADATGNSPNPNDVEHYYNYSQLYDDTGGIMPHMSNDLHLPSEYKELGHPNRFINGIDTTKEYAEGGYYPTQGPGKALFKGYPDGGKIKKDLYGTPIESSIVNDPSVNRSYYDSRLDQIILGTDYDNELDQEYKDKIIAHENYHAGQYKNDRSTLLPIKDIPYKKPSMASTDDVYYEYHNRKPTEAQIAINEFKKNNPGFNAVPDDIIFNNIVDPEQYLDTSTMEGEAKFYEDLGADVSKLQYRNGGYMYPDGGSKSPVKDLTYIPPTRQDSLDVLNNTLAINNYYLRNNYKSNPDVPLTKENRKVLEEHFTKKEIEDMENSLSPKNYLNNLERSRNSYKDLLEKKYKEKNINK
jgi:hypothetical protein